MEEDMEMLRRVWLVTVLLLAMAGLISLKPRLPEARIYGGISG